MIPGTTPTHTFTLPFTPPAGTNYRIVYAQGKEGLEEIVLELTTERCTVEGNSLFVTLTKEETLAFNSTLVWHKGRLMPLPVTIQVGVRTEGGDVMWSDIIETTVERCLRKDGVV